MEPGAATRMKERLQRENVTIGISRWRVHSAADLRRHARECTQEADRRSAAQAVLQCSTPGESVGKKPVATRTAIGDGPRIVVAGPHRRPQDIATFARQLENLRESVSGDDSHTEREREETDKRSLHWSWG